MTPKSLLAALKPAANTASKKSTLPVLECFRFRDGKVLTNDTTMQTTYPVDGIESLDCCINVAKLMKSLAAMPPDETMKLSVEKERVVLKAGRSRHVFPTLPADAMPTFETPVDVKGFITIPNMHDALARTHSFAAQPGDVRYYLTGIHLRSKQGRLIVEATDGHRCARLDAGPFSSEIDALIPVGAAQSLLWLTDPKVGLDSKQVFHAISGDCIVSTKVIDGRYPDVDRVIPFGFSDPLIFDKASLSAAIGGALTARASDKEKWIRIDLKPGEAIFRGVSNGGDVEAEDGCSFEGRNLRDTMTIGMNAEYIKTALSSLKGSKVAWYPDPTSASVFCDPEEDAWVSVIMPTRM